MSCHSLDFLSRRPASAHSAIRISLDGVDRIQFEPGKPLQAARRSSAMT
jgi:hypothetical protein